MKVEAFAPAKINLTLHVTGQREDGYHLLDSLVVFVDVGDVISAEIADTLRLRVTGPKSEGVPENNSNLVLKAAALFDGSKGAFITLEKHLPAASGIGGGSSDAAACLRALSGLWDVQLPDQDRLLALGADVPVCMTLTSQRMAGIGEDLSDVDGLPEFDILLVNPGVEVATPAIFNALQSRHNPPMPTPLPRFEDAAALAVWLKTQRNDLQPAAITLEPSISDVIDAVTEAGSLYAGMSGSGATCFGVFPPDGVSAKLALEQIRAAHPNWWSAAGKRL
ncbi:4-diphosphocytidyl-2-C-methyl-D-erythritol kinase [Shimia thalassica]|uniref:4-diphosphocytidyl-2-C-methyl-D-erythritol kinase n=1 Tax=Shimia thalassica TaxID=1715693 RepID=A0A0P1IJD5_9RHOB|nr:4-(cytidine 5'-diphospho)-2-C-methyl-D-erythritol kinase [Shimia thalassica]CUK05574.1 4-diphosphocytidyl-2-C-methyl-D-erythritol kinase [Shimia thalassica]